MDLNMKSSCKIKYLILLFFFGCFTEILSDQDRGPAQDTKCSGFKLVSRQAWHARPPVRTFPMVLPVSHVIIIHTVFGECEILQQCIRNLQFIQDYHMDDKGWWDIAYNFLVGGDGRIYEGVGWFNAAEHTVNYNTISIGLAFLGNFNNITPSDGMLDAAKSLISCGIKKGYLTPTVQINGHRDATCTSSPGNRLYKIIKQWPNFQGGRLPLYHCDAKAATPRVTED